MEALLSLVDHVTPPLCGDIFETIDSTVLLVGIFCSVLLLSIVLFDRKKLRNFRKDGHNWKKKKDGKTVKEAHEHLKVRILMFLGCMCVFT